MNPNALRTAWCIFAVVRIVAAGLACLSNPCSHGICIDDLNSTYSCYCIDGYTGVRCQTNWDECWSDPCQNGGTCIDGIASYNCTCPDGFVGDNCELNYNECESNPCQNNGTCIDMTNGFICSCVPGFAGDHCEIDIAVCNTTEEVRCYNGGHCIEGPGFKFYCRCLPGWTGAKCEDEIDECKSNPCQNGGICIDLHANYMCACPYGYTGKICEIQIEFCDGNSCSNNALCVVEDGVRVCYCVPDFHGERCELQYDECLLGPRCMNGGTCIDGVDNFTCSCPPMLTGSLCECLILEDGTYDCEYVSPTPILKSTVSDFLTTLYDGYTTSKEILYTTYSTESNNISISSSTILSVETTTPESVTNAIATHLTTNGRDMNNLSEYFTTTESVQVSNFTEQSFTLETSTKISTGSEEFKTSQTTSCHGICYETSEITSESSQLITETEYTEIANVTIYTTKESVETTTMTTSTSIADASKSTTTEIKELTDVSILNDTTTEKLFTDRPSEYSTTTQSPTTVTPYLTTETFETTTGIEKFTSITTEQSDCTEAFCNYHGTCINTPHGSQCHCAFNYRGRFCEDIISIKSAAFGSHSYIVHKLQNSTSIEIEFRAKTLVSDGQIMYVDLSEGVYIQLNVNSGMLKFKFSCGYQTMLLSELRTFVNKGYSMIIQTKLDIYPTEEYCNATLRLNDTVAMSGGQVANVTFLDHNSTLYFGNVPTKVPDVSPFIGCISDLMVNNGKRHVFEDAVDANEVTECSSLACLSGPCYNGGSCNEHDGTYSCSCANGWMGKRCEQSVCTHSPCHSGGSCVSHPGSGFLCLCPLGKHGIFCEYNVEITRPSLSPIGLGMSSYLTYPLSPAVQNSDRFELRLRFQTADFDQIALLAFVGQNGRHDSRSQHLALTFVKGYLMLTWNMGIGPRRVFTSRALSSRRGGHSVRVWRRGRTAGFIVDGRQNVSGNAPALETKMTLMPYVYIGGHPSKGFHGLPHDLPLHSGWRGCIWEIGGQAVLTGKAIGGRGVGQCGVAQCTAKSCNAPRGICIHSPATYGCICNQGWFGVTCSSPRNPCELSGCKGRCMVTTGNTTQCDCAYGKTGVHCDQDLTPSDVLFTGTRSYARLNPRTVSSVSLSLEAEIKPYKERGLLVFAQTPHFHTSLSLQGGLLEHRWTDRLSGVTSLVRSGVVLSMNEWHSVKAGRYGSRLYIWVDGALSTEAMLAHAYPHTASNATIVLGGAEDLADLPFDVMSGPPESYTGCIRNLHVNNILITLETQNIVSGQNLGDCDGTACGWETCGGNACVVEGGVAKCTCSSVSGSTGADTGGARCRRHTACSPEVCTMPRGFCRENACVCFTGYTGVDCQNKINITKPQFTGHSMLHLGANKVQTWHHAEQKIATNLTPSTFVHLNFTTAEPHGLLFWAQTEKDYLGLGLEEGILMMVWHSNYDNGTDDDARRVTNTQGIHTGAFIKSFPEVGFLADGEWHAIALMLKQNFSLIVDNVKVHDERNGLPMKISYVTDLYIGGVSERKHAAKKIFPFNFKGCIDNISTKENSFITNYINVYSENLNSCQLFP